jgi:uncharacterized protein (DUF952 family)
MSLILHMTPRAAWEAAQQSGSYEAESLAHEGFIHFSTPDQLVGVANTFYRGQTDLVLLVVESDRLTASLRYEGAAHPAPGGEPAPADALFPHLYGALNLDAVVKVLDFSPAEDGFFTLPAL